MERSYYRMPSDPSRMQNTHTEQHVSEQATERVPSHYPWLQHYEDGVPTDLTIPDRPLTWLLDQAFHRFPNQTAILYYGTRITYAQLSTQANRFAIALQRLGIQKGDRIALALPNIPQFPIAFYGALRAGAIVVPTNPLYTAPELQHQLTDAGAKAIVVLDMYYPLVRAIRDQTSLEQIIITSPADFLPPLLHALYPWSQRKNTMPQPPLSPKELENDATLHTMHTMLKTNTKGGIELYNLPVPTRGDDLAVLQYTGGTTGVSKGAMLTHRNLLANAVQTRSWVTQAQEGKEIALCVSPFFHAYGLTVGMNLSIYAGATMTLLPRFKISDVLNTIRRYHPTMFPGIPTMYIAIMREAGANVRYLESIKYCISGAAPLPASIQKEFERITRGKLVEGYGLSEASPVTHCNPLSDKCRNGSIGLPLPGIEATIISRETGEQLPNGEIGEIVVKGPNIMRGYWQREDDTNAVFINGWMRTGDVGRMDNDGYFYVVERAKDMILASGFNVYPREVEEVLFQHPSVAEAAVTGVADDYRGETVMAFIVLKAGIKSSEKLQQELITFCRERLTPYKVPKKFRFLDQLPKSLVGKVLRRELRQMA
jgi:long-chain acyl-CoA synthetase